VTAWPAGPALSRARSGNGPGPPGFRSASRSTEVRFHPCGALGRAALKLPELRFGLGPPIGKSLAVPYDERVLGSPEYPFA